MEIKYHMYRLKEIDLNTYTLKGSTAVSALWGTSALGSVVNNKSVSRGTDLLDLVTSGVVTGLSAVSNSVISSHFSIFYSHGQTI
jgi:hypothetical protein